MFYLSFIFIYGIYIAKNKFSNKLGFILQLLPMLLIILLRYGYGADYFSYKLMYDRINPNSPINGFNVYPEVELGFKVIIYLSKKIGLSYQQFLFTINSVTLGLYLIPIKKYSEDTSLSILMFYSMFYLVWILSGIRQGLAMAISLLLLISFIKKSKTFKMSDYIVYLILLFIAFSIHTVALYVIPLYLLSKIKWKRNTHLIIFCTSLIISQTNLVSNILRVIPILRDSKVLVYYLSESANVFDFPGLIRIFLFILVISFYKVAEKNKFYKKITDIFLAGSSIYFLLKFSEITASRTYIFVFILLTLIVPYIISQLDTNKKRVTTMLMFFPMFLYFNKELIALDSQSGLNQTSLYKKLPTKNNSSHVDFDTTAAFTTGLMEKFENLRKEFVENKKSELVEYSDEDEYIIIEDFNEKGKIVYKLMNQEGKILNTHFYRIPYKYQNGVIFVPEDTTEEIIRPNTFVDVTTENRNIEKLKDDYAKGIREDLDYDKRKYITPITVEELSPQVINHFSNTDEIQSALLYSFSKPFMYNIVMIEYLDRYYYMYLDSDLEPMINTLFTNYSEYSANGFITIPTSGGTMIINKKGETVWWH